MLLASDLQPSIYPTKPATMLSQLSASSDRRTEHEAKDVLQTFKENVRLWVRFIAKINMPGLSTNGGTGCPVMFMLHNKFLGYFYLK